MNPILRLALAAFAGILVAAVAAVGVTALFAPWIEFSLLVGLPVGIWVGLATAYLAGAALWHRDQAATEQPSRTTRSVLWSAVAVAAAVALVFAVGVAWSVLLGGSGALGLLIFGIPVTMVVAGVLGFVASRAFGDEEDGTTATPQ